MSTNKSFERNQSILWARDVLSRSEQFYIAYVSGTGTNVQFCTIDGRQKFALSLTDAAALRSKLLNYEVLYAGLPPAFVQSFKANAIRLHDVTEHFERFIGERLKQADTPQGDAALLWTRDTMTMMASAHLKLDQANTGDGTWTGSYFKPNPSVFDRLRNLMKS